MSDDGNSVAIGSIRFRGNGLSAGQARVFNWNGTDWVQVGNDINGVSVNDEFGSSLQLNSNGNTLVVGANRANPNTNSTGAVSVFSYNGTDWIQKGQVLPGATNNGEFGITTAISADGNTIAAGGHRESTQLGLTGAVRVFSFNGTTWDLKGSEIIGTQSGERFGINVALNDAGTILAVGAFLYDAFGFNSDTGRVKVYRFNDNNWEALGEDINGLVAIDRFGRGVALDAVGETLVAGASFSDANGEDSGQTRVFRFDQSLSVDDDAISKISVFPNPTSDAFTVNLGKVYNNVQLEIYDTLGKQILIKNYLGVRQINCDFAMEKGIYFINIMIDKNTSLVKKIIII